ncbi:MAG: hypothetical protein ABJA60_07125, partial [Nitrosospira sp.]
MRPAIFGGPYFLRYLPNKIVPARMLCLAPCDGFTESRIMMVALGMGLFLLASAATSSSNLTTTPCDFGEIYAFGTVSCEIALTNASDRPIRVFDFEPTKTSGSVTPSSVTVLPHSQSYVKGTINVGNASGLLRFPFRFKTDESGHENGDAFIRGFVSSALADPKLALDFGVVDLATKSAEKRISLSSQETATFRIAKIVSTPEWLKASVAEDGFTIIASIRPDAAWGLHNDDIKLAIETPNQKEAWVPVKADVHGEIVPSVNPLDMGLIRFGNRNEQLIHLTSRSGKKFKVGTLKLDGFKGTVKDVPCVPKSVGCHSIRLTVADDQPFGAMRGTILVGFPEYAKSLPIAVGAVIVGKDYKVDKLDSESAYNGTSKIPGKQDLATAIKNTIDQPSKMEDTPPAGSGPLLKWKISNGEQIYGFQIFRSSVDEKRAYIVMNKEYIRAAAHNNALSEYQWRDTSAIGGQTYWYYIMYVG